jgi:plasmid maintenance system antidote protein VapI
MKINIQYPNVSLEELDMMVKFYEQGLTTAQIGTQYKTMSATVLYVIKKYKGKLVYDKERLAEVVEIAKLGLTHEEFRKKFKISHDTYTKLVNGKKLTDSVLIRTLVKFGVEYTVVFPELKHRKVKRTKKRKIIENATEYNQQHYNKYHTDPILEDNDNFEDLQEKGDISEVSTNTALIENYRKQMKKFLIDKGLSIETVNYVLDKSDSIARESTLFGIQCERLGKGQKLEKSIVNQFQTFRD